MANPLHTVFNSGYFDRAQPVKNGEKMFYHLTNLDPIYILVKKAPHEVAAFFEIPESAVEDFVASVFEPLVIYP